MFSGSMLYPSAGRDAGVSVAQPRRGILQQLTASDECKRLLRKRPSSEQSVTCCINQVSTIPTAKEHHLRMRDCPDHVIRCSRAVHRSHRFGLPPNDL
jgi:hypothetical protein